MHNNRYSTGEGVMRLFTVDHPQITLSPKGEGGTRRPPPRTCYVLFRPQPLSCPFMVSCGYYVVTGYEITAVRYTT